ncbi:type IV secretory system conjugative DNA transfer family protein [Xanthomonas albilineans]|uniref:type IV secretory system conjugative DNA transfer family protein n=1 Tax=Xanthomonas albilineans TaxID=29447 RepID=UPI0005F34968|nr:type IV secretory system conjugative DNA transfer family protein [Xanthomonas albilineans]
MGMKARFGTALVLLLLAAFAGLYLSGYITLLLLKLNIPLEWNTYLQYVRALGLPQVQPYAMKIKLGGILGFGLTFIVWLPLNVILLRLSRRNESLHGDAGFANLHDMKRAGLLEKKPESIIIGKYRGHHLYINGALHVMVVAPTRSGKTTCIAIPVLLTYEHSMCVLDIKGELFKETSGWRASQGQRIYKFAPYATDGKTHRFNPLSFVRPSQYIADLQTIAAILYPDAPGKDPFWATQARAIFVAFASFMFEKWEDMERKGFPGADAQGKLDLQAPLDPNVDPAFPSFERILRLSSGAGSQSIKKVVNRWLSASDQQEFSFISEQTRTTLRNLIGMAEQTFSSVVATMQAPLQQFLNPTLAAATNATDFDVTAIRKQKTTIYTVIPAQKLDESGKLLNIFFSTVIGNNLDKQLGDDPALKYQMLMLMDEFTAMGRVDVWAKRISISASYGVRDLCIIQSNAQLRSVYGEHDAQNFTTNHAGSVVYTPHEQTDANAYSEQLGFKTIRTKHRSSGGGAQGGNYNIHYTEEKRALMLPQELKELPSDDALLFLQGCKPIRCKKNWFFKDSFFKKRIRPPVEIVPIRVIRDQRPEASNDGE